MQRSCSVCIALSFLFLPFFFFLSQSPQYTGKNQIHHTDVETHGVGFAAPYMVSLTPHSSSLLWWYFNALVLHTVLRLRAPGLTLLKESHSVQQAFSSRPSRSFLVLYLACFRNSPKIACVNPAHYGNANPMAGL